MQRGGCFGLGLTILLLCGLGWFWNSSTVSREALAQTSAANPKNKAAAPLKWQNATAAQRQAAAKVIRTQLDAFKTNDWKSAVKYQSANLKRHFPSLNAFRVAIQTTYPQFAAYKAVSFGQAIAAGNYLQIQAKVTGSDGVAKNAVYVMVKENGAYRVDGVAGGIATPEQRGVVA